MESSPYNTFLCTFATVLVTNVILMHSIKGFDKKNVVLKYVNTHNNPNLTMSIIFTFQVKHVIKYVIPPNFLGYILYHFIQMSETYFTEPITLWNAIL